MKAVKVATSADAESAFIYDGTANLILFDAKAADDRRECVGGRQRHHLRLAGVAHACGQDPYMLAGGLTPENVVDAIRLTGASAVDVSSGVEERPGEKDPELIRRFLRAAKTAKQGSVST